MHVWAMYGIQTTVLPQMRIISRVGSHSAVSAVNILKKLPVILAAYQVASDVV